MFSSCPVNYSTYCIFTYNILYCVCLLCLQAGQLSYEEAIIAKQAYHQENKEKVKVIKEESKQIMNTYFREQEEQQKEMRKLVETIAEGRENVKEAKDKLQKMKQSIGMPVFVCVGVVCVHTVRMYVHVYLCKYSHVRYVHTYNRLYILR